MIRPLPPGWTRPVEAAEGTPWCNLPICPEQDAHHISTGRCLVVAAEGTDELREFAEWVASLDDDDPESPGRIDRRTVTLTAIVARARFALDAR